MIDPKILKAFKRIYPELTNPARKPIHWAVTGSLGMVLHGMTMEIHDIDIQTDKEGAYEIERRLVTSLVKLVHFKASEIVRSYFGVFEVEGIKIEVMGGLQHRSLDQSWLPPVQVELHKEWIDYEGMSIPVMSLTHEAEAYDLYRRTEKAQKIKEFIAKK